MTKNELEEFLPLEKSWVIRMGLLDLIHGRDQIKTFLDGQDNLGDDLLALKGVVRNWHTHKPLNVGESGTLYRFLLFVSWSLDLNKEFIISGTLKDRRVTHDSSITDLSQKELLKLDGRTSQWASAKALLGDQERLEDPPHLLAITYEALEHWNGRILKNLDWKPKLDRTIESQSDAFLELLEAGETSFSPAQAEDYCFARAFGLITKEEGEKRWPALRNHESDRIDSMEKELKRAGDDKPVLSRDHRVTQAIAMWAKLNKKDVQFEHPESVNKTWPLFWRFLDQL